MGARLARGKITTGVGLQAYTRRHGGHGGNGEHRGEKTAVPQSPVLSDAFVVVVLANIMRIEDFLMYDNFR